MECQESVLISLVSYSQSSQFHFPAGGQLQRLCFFLLVFSSVHPFIRKNARIMTYDIPQPLPPAPFLIFIVQTFSCFTLYCDIKQKFFRQATGQGARTLPDPLCKTHVRLLSAHYYIPKLELSLANKGCWGDTKYYFIMFTGRYVMLAVDTACVKNAVLRHHTKLRTLFLVLLLLFFLFQIPNF